MVGTVKGKSHRRASDTGAVRKKAALGKKRSKKVKQGQRLGEKFFRFGPKRAAETTKPCAVKPLTKNQPEHHIKHGKGTGFPIRVVDASREKTHLGRLRS